VIDLIERKWKKRKYRPGGSYGPRKWNWFLKVIGKEFSAAERAHLPEHPAMARPEHQTSSEALERGMEAF
jgi:hypothetical protein